MLVVLQNLPLPLYIVLILSVEQLLQPLHLLILPLQPRLILHDQVFVLLHLRLVLAYLRSQQEDILALDALLLGELLVLVYEVDELGLCLLEGLLQGGVGDFEVVYLAEEVLDLDTLLGEFGVFVV